MSAPGAGTTRLGWRRLAGGLAGMLTHVAGGIALLSAPEAYTVAAVGPDGTCHTPDGPADLTDVYEARVFTPERELRWVRRPGGGDGVLLGEALTGDGVEERHGLGTLDTTYLLWGERWGSAGDGGWTVLSSGRVGRLAVPVRGTGDHARLRLVAREYVAVEPVHGNSYVYDERLLRIEETDGRHA